MTSQQGKFVSKHARAMFEFIETNYPNYPIDLYAVERYEESFCVDENYVRAFAETFIDVIRRNLNNPKVFDFNERQFGRYWDLPESDRYELEAAFSALNYLEGKARVLLFPHDSNFYKNGKRTPVAKRLKEEATQNGERCAQLLNEHALPLINAKFGIACWQIQPCQCDVDSLFWGFGRKIGCDWEAFRSCVERLEVDSAIGCGSPSAAKKQGSARL